MGCTQCWCCVCSCSGSSSRRFFSSGTFSGTAAMLGAFSRPQPPPAGGPGDRDAMELVCPVCLEIFDSPMVTQCGHKFCNRCLQECLRPKKPVCAVCRAELHKWSKAADLEALIRTTSKPCKGCGEEVERCSLSPVPNRYTFLCPYCREPNLDQDGLVEHCNSQHARDPRPVVCPICSSMPWGDPNYKSSDFFQHLRIRHTFSYDTFVVSAWSHNKGLCRCF
uniref:Ring finger protein 114 n=1 Tax=Astyanax mexicanus TaxID=7994 RepID=W5KSZ6_ASTMX